MSSYIYDIETNGLLDSMTKIHCIGIMNVETGEKGIYHDDTFDKQGTLKDAVELLNNADKIIAHNGIFFDNPAIKKLFPEFNPKGRVIDTLVTSRLIFTNLKEVDFKRHRQGKLHKGMQFGSHALAAWGKRLGVLKGDYGHDTDWQTLDQEMITYCLQDLEVTATLLKFLRKQKYSTQAIELEHRFANVIQRQVETGFHFDRKKAAKLYSGLLQRQGEVDNELQSIFPGWDIEMKTPEYWTVDNHKAPTKGDVIKKAKAFGFMGTLKSLQERVEPGPMKVKHIPLNPGSRDHIAKCLMEKYKWRPKDYGDNGKPTIDEAILKGLPYPEAALFAEYLMLDKRIGQLSTGRQAWLQLEKEGKIHGSLNTNGAVTGRCTHSHPNVAQVPSLKSPYGGECRGLFIPKAGLKLVGADASGLELRCLSHYLAKWDGGKYVKIILDGDVHSANQKAAGLPTRDDAKTFIYAFIYGAGDGKLGSITGGGVKNGRQLRSKFLTRLPALAKLITVVKASSKKGWINGIDGRKLHIRSEHAALNTLLQSAGAVLMKEATCLCVDELESRGYVWGKDFAQVAHIHDEVQIEARPEIADEVGKCFTDSLKKAGDIFNFKCPVDGEYKIGSSWAETH